MEPGDSVFTAQGGEHSPAHAYQHRHRQGFRTLAGILFALSELLFPSHLPAQPFTVQFPSDTISTVQQPTVLHDTDGRIWVAYYSPDCSHVLVGCYSAGGWAVLPPIRLSQPRESDHRAYVTMDSANRLWCAYRDTASTLRLDVIETGSPVAVGTISRYNPTNFRTGLTSGPRGDVWAWNKTTLVHAQEQRINTALTSLSTVGLTSFLAGEAVSASVYEHRFVGHSSGSAISESYVVFQPSGRSILLVRAFNSYTRDVFTFTYSGNETLPFAVGGNGSRALYLNRYNPNVNGQPRVDAYLLDDTVHHHWWGILRTSPNNLTVSDGPGPHAMAWIQGGRVYSKFLLGTVWTETDSTQPFVVDSLPPFLSIVCTKDTTLWVAFAAVRNGLRSVFLTSLTPSRTPDRQASPYQLPRQLQATSPADTPPLLPNRVVLTWQDDPPAEWFHVQLSADSLFTLRILDTLVQPQPRLTIGPLSAPQRYFWRVAGANLDGEGPWSNPARFTTRIVPPLIHLSPTSDSTLFNPATIVFRWHRHADARHYRIGLSASTDLFGSDGVYLDWTTDTVAVIPAPALPNVYYWHLSAELADGSTIATAVNRLIVIHDPLARTVPGAAPTTWRIHQPYPNPFNATVAFRVDLPSVGTVRITVVDLLGREIAQVYDGWLPTGTFDIPWSPTGIASGIYVARIMMEPLLTAQGGVTQSVKVLLVR